jgi:hypothetical protein
MKITIDIDENELKELVTRNIADQLSKSWSIERRDYRREFKEIAKEILYEKKTKERLIESAVDTAAKELCRKGLPKLLEMGGINAEHGNKQEA